MEIKLKNEIEKKGIYHKNEANNAPKMGLNALPNVFDVSTIPKQAPVFVSSPLKRSPTNGITIGNAPAAPMPCNTRPIIIQTKGSVDFQEAKPAIRPPIKAKIRLGMITIFLPNRSDR